MSLFLDNVKPHETDVKPVLFNVNFIDASVYDGMGNYYGTLVGFSEDFANYLIRVMNQVGTLPYVNSTEGDELIEKEMAAFGHPCNPKAAARAGYCAAIKHICKQENAE